MPHRTIMLRATLAQEARIFLSAGRHWRQIQLIVPDSPKVFVGIDVHPAVLGVGGSLSRKAIERIGARASDNSDRTRRINMERERGIPHPPLHPASPDKLTLDMALQAIGWDRKYKLPELTNGPPISFILAPGQFVTGMASEGHATLAVIVEWAAPPRGMP